ncbi:MAG: head-tail connector protein [Herbinix sp.]|nr:head-tail connector protein [Herbinix sp.]
MLIDDVKQTLRINTTALDTEVNDIIESAKVDLVLSGILKSKTVEDDIEGYDSLIKRAIIFYTKANFGLDNSDSEKYQKAYDSLKTHLALSQEYTVEAVV